MPKRAKELTALEVKRLASSALPTSRPFNYVAVGGVPGLLLRIARSGACYWVLRYSAGTRTTRTGKQAPARRDLGLGGYPELPLKEARELARRKRQDIRDGGDPVEARREARRARQDEQSKHLTFADAVEITKRLEKIGDDKAGKAWKHKIETYAMPTLGPIPIAQIDRDHIKDVLAPIWSTKTRTSKDVRKLVEDVIDRGYADKNIGRDNPARWCRALEKKLPKTKKKSTHFPALPYRRIGTFIANLRQRDHNLARAVEFLVLTGARSGEVRGATWKEIDLERRLWTVPAERMKKNEEHRVYLSEASLRVLKSMPRGGPDDPVFPTETGRHPQDARLSQIVREIASDMDCRATIHGMRASFRTWGEEQTDYREPVLEAAIAHKVPDPVVAAYGRGDFMKHRRSLLEEWAAYCEKPSPDGEVVSLEGAA